MNHLLASHFNGWNSKMTGFEKCRRNGRFSKVSEIRRSVIKRKAGAVGPTLIRPLLTK
jgi:hypothetical protein